VRRELSSRTYSCDSSSVSRETDQNTALLNIIHEYQLTMRLTIPKFSIISEPIQLDYQQTTIDKPGKWNTGESRTLEKKQITEVMIKKPRETNRREE